MQKILDNPDLQDQLWSFRNHLIQNKSLEVKTTSHEHQARNSQILARFGFKSANLECIRFTVQIDSKSADLIENPILVVQFKKNAVSDDVLSKAEISSLFKSLEVDIYNPSSTPTPSISVDGYQGLDLDLIYTKLDVKPLMENCSFRLPLPFSMFRKPKSCLVSHMTDQIIQFNIEITPELRKIFEDLYIQVDEVKLTSSYPITDYNYWNQQWMWVQTLINMGPPPPSYYCEFKSWTGSQIYHPEAELVLTPGSYFYFLDQNLNLIKEVDFTMIPENSSVCSSHEIKIKNIGGFYKPKLDMGLDKGIVWWTMKVKFHFSKEIPTQIRMGCQESHVLAYDGKIARLI